MSGRHAPGCKPLPFVPAVDRHALQTAHDIEVLFQGQFAVLWSPAKQVFTAISALPHAEEPILDDSSTISLKERMRAQILRALQTPDPRPPQRGSPSIDPTYPRWGS
jgi:hypothetical protein